MRKSNNKKTRIKHSKKEIWVDVFVLGKNSGGFWSEDDQQTRYKSINFRNNSVKKRMRKKVSSSPLYVFGKYAHGKYISEIYFEEAVSEQDSISHNYSGPAKKSKSLKLHCPIPQSR